ncbi:hypothetical protein OIU78_000212 [Salix suchowensis]|nr:hypothetical protein OIU78_000212 [Salix suchowensis]
MKHISFRNQQARTTSYQINSIQRGGIINPTTTNLNSSKCLPKRNSLCNFTMDKINSVSFLIHHQPGL